MLIRDPAQEVIAQVAYLQDSLQLEVVTHPVDTHPVVQAMEFHNLIAFL